MVAAAPAVLLGLAGDLVGEPDAADWYASRVGGLPRLPPGLPAAALDVTCAACSSALPLVAQVYAPLSRAQAGVELPERALCVYGCTAPACARDPRAWRAFRCQLRAVVATPPTAAAADLARADQAPRDSGCQASGAGCGERAAAAQAEPGSYAAGTAPVAAGCNSEPDNGAEASCSGVPEHDTGRRGEPPPAAPALGAHAAVVGDCWGGSGGWGASEDDWGCSSSAGAAWGTDKAAPPGGDAFDFSDLNEQLECAATSAAAAPASAAAAPAGSQPRQPGAGPVRADCVQSGGTLATEAEGTAGIAALGSATALMLAAAHLPNTASSSQDGSAGPRAARGPPVLPGFYLDFEEEPGRSGKRRRRTTNEQEQRHVAQLLAEYEREHAAPAHQADKEAGSSAAAAQGEAWGGETYEPDRTAGADAAFLKFSKRLQRSPQQCLRYSFGGELLWPAAQQPEPRACGACGAPRTAELVLVPPLVAMVEEAAAWLGEGARAQLASVDAWEWVAVAVFVCSASCQAGSGSQVGSICWAEEQVAVHFE